ncbi:MAG: phage portal protein [Pyrinomonadaceae bacterium]
MNIDIEQALLAFRTDAPRYARSERYYRGEHDLSFATEKFKNAFGTLFREFALNLCPAVCQAVGDKLKVKGFSIDRGPSGDSDEVKRVWSDNRMALRSREVHKEALKNGDAYVIVWPASGGRIAIHPNRASSCTAVYDDESPGVVIRAAKYWRTADRRTRLNMFYPDRIEKYVSAGETEGWLPEAAEFVPVAGEEAVVENPFGVVSVFHFANNSDIGMSGTTEIEAAIPIQDGLNKAVLDMLVAMEFSAFRQRWAAGIEIEYDENGNPKAPFEAGVDRIWLAENAEARFGDFNTADLEQFLKVKDSFRTDIASVTGTPLYYVMPDLHGFPSGESMRKAETRFLAKVRDRQESFGQVWADVMAFALAAEGRDGSRLNTLWEDAGERTEREVLENILLKRQIGITVEQALVEAGYGEAEAQQMSKDQFAPEMRI